MYTFNTYGCSILEYVMSTKVKKYVLYAVYKNKVYRAFDDFWVNVKIYNKKPPITCTNNNNIVCHYYYFDQDIYVLHR